MSFEAWFEELDIGNDIEEVFCLFRAVKERASFGSYEVKESGKTFVVSNCWGAKHRFSPRTQLSFCNYLDSRYELTVEGEYELQRNMRKDSDRD